MRKNPIIIGIVNAVLPGAGYVLINERIVFGWLLLIGSLAAGILMFVEPTFNPASLLVSGTLFGKALQLVWYILFLLAYGYDAYDLAKKKYTSHNVLL